MSTWYIYKEVRISCIKIFFFELIIKIRLINSFRYSLQRWKYLLKDNIQHDDEFKNTVAVSLRELNPKNPWILDKKGRHTNLLALLNDLPELEDELDSILIPAKDRNGLCARSECSKWKNFHILIIFHWYFSFVFEWQQKKNRLTKKNMPYICT